MLLWGHDLLEEVVWREYFRGISFVRWDGLEVCVIFIFQSAGFQGDFRGREKCLFAHRVGLGKERDRVI